MSLKGEALYMDFGKQSYSFTDHAPPPGDFYAFEHRANVVTARVGLNIKLGDVPPRNGCGRDDCDARPLK